jgi:mRNA interferase MazF
VVTVVLPGGLGKPRPAVVIQAEVAGLTTATITVLPFTSTQADAPLVRIEVAPTEPNGLERLCYVQVDKATSPPRAKIGALIGHLDDVTMLTINRALAVFLGLA